MYIYIYVYRERVRERERQTDREAEIGTPSVDAVGLRSPLRRGIIASLSIHTQGGNRRQYSIPRFEYAISVSKLLYRSTKPNPKI